MPDLQDAISLLEKGDAREASVVLEAMAEEMPGYATARVLLARSYEGLGEWKSALSSWREALHIVPNSPVIRRGLERAARKAASRAPIDELPELPSMSVSTPSPTVTDASPDETEPENIAPPDDLTPPEAEAGPSEVDEAPAEGEDVPADASIDTPPDAGAPDFAPHDWSDEIEEAGHDVPAPPPEDQDIDRLIAELQSARIEPRPDLESLPAPDLEDDIEDVVSVTLARIYASQGQYHEAARVYDLLAGQQPENEAAFKAKAAEMRSKAPED